jgi:predicted amidophosphoribosyltransferase
MRGSSESKDDWMPAVFLLLLAVLAAGVLWFNLRSTGPATEKGGDKRFCSQCGNKLHRGDRFCSKCGTAVG